MKYGDENTNVRNVLEITLTHILLNLCHLKCCYMFQEGGRLLYIGQNEWTHVNCALWSAEVFEDDDGSLKNVHMAVLRGKQLVRRDTLSFTNSWRMFNVFLLDRHVQPVVLLCFVFSTVRSVKSQAPQLAAASPLAPVTTTSCAPASATVSS